MNIEVNTDSLKKFSGVIKGYGASYLSEVSKLYETVNALHQSWKGTDSSAYVEKIKSYKTDIEDLGKAIENYGNFLEESAGSIAYLRSQIQTESSKL